MSNILTKDFHQLVPFSTQGVTRNVGAKLETIQTEALLVLLHIFAFPF